MENKQHIQLPNGLIKVEAINPKDLLIYIVIKSFQNKDNKKSLVSLDKIKERSNASKNTITKSINKLIESGYISREKYGKCYIYSFSEYKQFEVFSYDFLDKPDLTFSQKAYYVANQPLMIKDENTKTGKITYSNPELSDKLHMPIRTIQNYDMMLKAKKYLNVVRTNARDEAGFFKMEKIFDLKKFGQAVIFILKNHEERISKIEKRQDEDYKEREQDKALLKEANKRITKANTIIKDFKKDNGILRRDNAEKDAKIVEQEKIIQQLQRENLELKTNNKVSLDEEGNKIYKL